MKFKCVFSLLMLIFMNKFMNCSRFFPRTAVPCGKMDHLFSVKVRFSGFYYCNVSEKGS